MSSPISFPMNNNNNDEMMNQRQKFEDTTGQKPQQGDKDAEARLLGPKPKRPLTAYNLFFQSERLKILETHGKCGFSSMGKTIAKKWSSNTIDPQERSKLTELARQEKLRYGREISDYKSRKAALSRNTKKLVTVQKKTQIIKSSIVRTHHSPVSVVVFQPEQQQQLLPLPNTVSMGSIMSQASSSGSLVSSFIRQKKSMKYSAVSSRQNSVMPAQPGQCHQVKDLEQGDPSASLPLDSLASLMPKPSTRLFRHIMEHTMSDDDFDSALDNIFQDDDDCFSL